jgi:hypothetical protein
VGVGYIARVPRRALILAAALCCGTSACGGGADYANKDRPASPINVAAAISTKKISISPKTFGAGQVVLIVSNQTAAARTLTFQTQELAGSKPGMKATSDKIAPQGTGTMQVNVREGSYEISAGSDVAPARVKVGKPRKSAQNELLQP